MALDTWTSYKPTAGGTDYPSKIESLIDALQSALTAGTTDIRTGAITSEGDIVGDSVNGITALSSANPLMNGVAASGAATTVARADHVHPVDTSRAALAGSAGQDFATKILTTIGLSVNVTPNTWNTFTPVEIGSSGNGIAAALATTDLFSGCYYNSGWKASNATYGATRYEQGGGTHAWYLGGVVAVGAACFGGSQMSLDSSGLTVSTLSGSGSRTVTANAAGVLSASSDSSLKTEVNQTLPGLAEILQLKNTVRAYRWNKDIEIRGEEAAIEIGFFADLVAPILPSAAPIGAEDKYGFYDRSVIAALVNSIDTLHERIAELETR